MKQKKLSLDELRKKSKCRYHQWGVVHVITKDGFNKVYDNGYDTMENEVMRHFPNVKQFPSYLYRHGMTANDLMRAVEKKEVTE